MCMLKKKTKLQLAQEQAEAAIKRTNEKIDELGLKCQYIQSFYVIFNYDSFFLSKGSIFFCSPIA